MTVPLTLLGLHDDYSWDGRPIRLLSCSVGKESYAQELADRLDVPVYAPSDILEVLDDGGSGTQVSSAGGRGLIFV